eukprot:1136666-Pelagomonas_calceolata.AAC.3
MVCAQANHQTLWHSLFPIALAPAGILGHRQRHEALEVWVLQGRKGRRRMQQRHEATIAWALQGREAERGRCVQQASQLQRGTTQHFRVWSTGRHVKQAAQGMEVAGRGEKRGVLWAWQEKANSCLRRATLPPP